MKNNKKGLLIFLAILAATVVVALNSTTAESMENLTVGESLAVINIVGTISINDGSTYDQEWLLQTIEQVTEDSNNRGILLYVDSPGGGVYESDEVYLKLLDYKKQTGRPVYVSMAQMAASGAYYISMAGDKLYANRNGLTGSIGVIYGSGVDLTGLMEKLGIKMSTFTSGRNKNMMGVDAPMTEEQRAIMQSIVNEAYEQFVGIVVQGRQLDEQVVRQLADGRPYTAQQALAHGLIDGIATFEETKQRMAEDLSLQEPTFHYYAYEKKDTLWDKLLMVNTRIFDKTSELEQLQKALAPLAGAPAYYCTGLGQ